MNFLHFLLILVFTSPLHLRAEPNEDHSTITANPESLTTELGGAFTGGGGGILSHSSSGKPVLADFLFVFGDFADKPEIIYKNTAYKAHRPSSQEAVERHDSFLLAAVLLQEWVEEGVWFADLGLKGEVQRKFVNHAEMAKIVNNSPSTPPIDSLIAWYNFKKQIASPTYQLAIQIETFSELGIWSQTGAVVHESIRHAQWGANPDRHYFSDENLQIATSIITLCQPDIILASEVNKLLSENKFQNAPNLQNIIQNCQHRSLE